MTPPKFNPQDEEFYQDIKNISYAVTRLIIKRLDRHRGLLGRPYGKTVEAVLSSAATGFSGDDGGKSLKINIGNLTQGRLDRLTKTQYEKRRR